jgi:hypothetical protein
MGVAFAQTAHIAQASPDALLGVVAYRTGIDKDYIGLLNILGVEVTLLLHDGYNNLRVADIHLATIGLDKEFASVAHKRA